MHTGTPDAGAKRGAQLVRVGRTEEGMAPLPD